HLNSPSVSKPQKILVFNTANFRDDYPSTKDVGGCWTVKFTKAGSYWQRKFLRKRSRLEVPTLPPPTKFNWQSLRPHFAVKSVLNLNAHLCASSYLSEWPVGIA
ncbi:MAG: hypothetical protein HRT36_08070, partial [Alphaproteobacteria bacterium]|nr:hypothetical protein [Alphaproteobacteria bacterium]